MNCGDLASLLASSSLKSLTPDQRAKIEAHQAGCPECKEFAAALEATPNLGKIESRFTPPDLDAVRPIPSVLTVTAVSVSVLLALVALTSITMGHRGWQRMSTIQVVATALFGMAGTTGLMYGFYAQFKPGTRIAVNARWSVFVVALAFVEFAILLFPWQSAPERFVFNALACMCLGTTISLAAAGAALWTLRRGYVLDERSASLWTGTLSSVAGITALQVYCFHEGAEHMLAGHLPVVLLTVLATIVLVRRNLFQPNK